MAAHNANGLRIAEWLDQHAAVEQVYYPGLPSHPQHELARRQMRGFTGMISIEMGSKERAAKFVNNVRIFSLAESLGGVESLIGHPAMMTHASIPRERRYAMGLTDGLVRLSCGVEDVEDLIADLLLGVHRQKSAKVRKCESAKVPGAKYQVPSAKCRYLNLGTWYLVLGTRYAAAAPGAVPAPGTP